MFFKTIFNQNKNNNQQLEQNESGDTKGFSGQNPYLDRTCGRKIWNDRYMNLSKARRHWQGAFFVLSLITLILLINIFTLSTQSKIKPVVVELNKGLPVGILPVSDNIPGRDKLTEFAINQFITNARTILSDSEAEKLLLTKTYAFSAEETLNFLRDYYNEHNPFERAGSSTVQVVILNSLKIGNQTWQVTWDEVEKSKVGEATLNQARYMATLTTQQGEPSPKFLQENPFGIYITHLAWSKIKS